jgi:transcriptional regulator with XRE-family HTH domain
MTDTERKERFGALLRSSLAAMPRGSQMRLAEAAGVSKATVSRWASGSIIADMDRWSVIENFFDWEPGRVATELGAIPGRSLQDELDDLRDQVAVLEGEVRRLMESLGAQPHLG